MHIGIMGFGSVAKELVILLKDSNHKLFSYQRKASSDKPRDENFKKIWPDIEPMIKYNQIEIVVDCLSDDDQAMLVAKPAIETSLKCGKNVIVCNKRMMDIYGKELCEYSKTTSGKLWINSLVASSEEFEPYETYVSVDNFNEMYEKRDLFIYRGAGPKETAEFIYQEILRIVDNHE